MASVLRILSKAEKWEMIIYVVVFLCSHPPEEYGAWAMFVFAPVDVCHSPIECISGVEREVSLSSCCARGSETLEQDCSEPHNLQQSIPSHHVGVVWSTICDLDPDDVSPGIKSGDLDHKIHWDGSPR